MTLTRRARKTLTQNERELFPWCNTFVTWYSRCHGMNPNTWTCRTSDRVFKGWGTVPLIFISSSAAELDSVIVRSFLGSLQCRKEPTTTVLQLAALVGTWGHKACQWRTAVGQPKSTLSSIYIKHNLQGKSEQNIIEVKFLLKRTFWSFDFCLLLYTCSWSKHTLKYIYSYLSLCLSKARVGNPGQASTSRLHDPDRCLKPTFLWLAY